MKPDQIGPLLYLLRCRNGKSRAALARRSGVSQEALRNYETGVTAPTLDTLLRLLEDQRMRPAYFFAFVEVLDAARVDVTWGGDRVNVMLAGFTLPHPLADSLLAVANGLARLYALALSLPAAAAHRRQGPARLDGRALALLRVARGWSPRRTAEAAGITRYHLTDLEKSDRAPLEQLVQVARALGYKPAALDRAALCLELLAEESLLA